MRRGQATRARAEVWAALDVWAACKAAVWASRCGLPAGNLWEPGIARAVAADVRALGDTPDARRRVAESWRFQLFGGEA